MPIAHSQFPSFKPRGTGGGSEKGKPQWLWPILIIVVGEAILIRAHGSHEAFVADRRSPMSVKDWAAEVERYLPGVWEWIQATSPSVTYKPSLLWNRVYKGGKYSGTSDRGPRHDPRTRANPSGERWTMRTPADHPFHKIHQAIINGTQLPIVNWRDFL